MVRTSLNGKWRIAQRPALMLSLLCMIGMGLVAWVPQDLEVLRVTGLVFSMFASGMLVSQHAAIWERSGNETRPPAENEVVS